MGERTSSSAPDRLLDAAAALVVEDGWGEVSTRRVADRAGVPPGLVHYHFDSVDHLTRQAVLRALRAEIDRVVGPMQELTPRQIIAGAGDVLGTAGPSDPLTLLLVEALPVAARDPDLRAEFADVLTWFRDLLAHRIRSCHPAPAAPPEVIAQLVAAAFDGLGMHLLALPDLDVGAHLHPLVELLGPEREDVSHDRSDDVPGPEEVPR